MRFDLVLNGQAGTLRGLDVQAVAAEITEHLADGGHDVSSHVLAGGEAIKAIEEICRKKSADAIIVGGGDGTISAAAAAAAESGMTLGILPLGTMNLFARSLGIPLELHAAAEALATAEPVNVDIGEVNGRYFTHHVTLGLHPRMIRLRERSSYGSRLGKIWASTQALWTTLRQPPRLDVRIALDGKIVDRRTAAVFVTNNPLGEGHLPYADDPRRGRLGVYVATSRRFPDLAQLTAQMTVGDVRENPLLESWEAGEADISLVRRRVRASVDGEIVWLQAPLKCRLLHGGLSVLKPLPSASP